MYAIVDIAGQQFKVEAGKQIFVNRQAAEVGASLEFDKVLLIDEEGKVKVGAPYVGGAKVKTKVLEHCKADKVIIFKKNAASSIRRRTVTVSILPRFKSKKLLSLN